MGKQILQYAKHQKKIIMIICVLIAIYSLVSIHFINHFYFGSTINCIDVSNKTVQEAEEEILSKTDTYSLELEERYDVKERINGKDINLIYDLGNKIKELKNKQIAFGWILSFLGKENYVITDAVSYNEDLLKKSFINLSCVTGNSVVEPKNPELEYKDNGYIINKEIYGNKINKDALYEHLIKAIMNGEEKINLESINCYENPKYISTSKEVIDAKNKLDRYVASKITYSFGEDNEVIDGSIIHNWLKVSQDYSVTIDEKKVYEYMKKIANTYNTSGKTRDFKTSLGTITKVSGGNYGWIIDTSQEAKELIKDIEKGENIAKEPIYKQVALSHDSNDIGNTYVEINMNIQHLWYYKNGILVIEGDVVTGNASRGSPTPTGVYQLNYKQKDATLKGENYSSPVSFWMPFYGNVGIHDASWRSEFGGNIYKANGSHGCVNAPYYLAKVLFNNIEEGTPVVCY
ncbi:L,D-transpeptidase family protein [Clostridium beijerinckii]|uniref:L,D-transpeptidase family protein n=1 Tax=Clostridium beijerinckii TaxID=1520 RepID=UPI000479B995|nr:peptidoglycan binding domain-containing protein [Clostridium beijerinckii]